MAKDKKITKYYFLKINNEYIIDLTDINGLENTPDFLNLNVFTSSFENEKELIVALKQMNKISADLEVKDISIVIRRGDKRKGHYYEFITHDISYKSEAPFLSAQFIRTFIHNNLKNGNIIYELSKAYIEGKESLLYNKKERAKKVDELLKYGPNPKLQAEYNALQKTIQLFHNGTENLYTMIGFANSFRQGNIPGDYEMDEYRKCADAFIDSEIYYTRDGKKTPNNRGLVKMAHLLSGLEHAYIIAPNQIYDIEEEPDYQLPEIDPDHYMFLEDEDFENLLSENPTKNEEESIEDSIENLNVLKNGTKRF